MAVKVLILEDNPVARSFLCRVVRESFSDTIAITEAGDMESARRRLGETLNAQGAAGEDPFKLILVDLELPDGNGMELLAKLSELHYPATKIVTTLYSDDDHLFPALQCGADGYLLKEDRFEVLVEELQKIVRGQPPLSPAIARRLLTHFREGGVQPRGPGSNGGGAAAAGTVSLGGGKPPNSHGGGAAAMPPAAPSTGLTTALGAAQSTAHNPAPAAAQSTAFMSASGFTTSRAAVPEKSTDWERLTPRESEVLTYLSKGFTIKEIASLMGIKWFTVNDHIKSIYKKLNVSSRAEAAVLASKQGLV
jgi:two-component system, NarL family, nitrate/nitrite response regulator NarL